MYFGFFYYSGRVLRPDVATVTEIRVNSLSEQRIQSLERSTESKTQGTRRRKYLRPGQLAKLVDEHKKSCTSNGALGKKKLVENINFRRRPLATEVEIQSTPNVISPSSMSPVPTIQVFGPAYPQRKKLVAPRTPLTPASHLTVMQTPLRRVEFPSQSESPLEGLPVELLVRFFPHSCTVGVIFSLFVVMRMPLKVLWKIANAFFLTGMLY